MAKNDEGFWNIVQAGVPVGTNSMTISALTTVLKPTGAETQVQVVWNGEVCDLNVLRFLVQ